MLQKLKFLLFRSLVFLRVVDPFDKNISITNIALCITLYKFCMTPNASMVDVSAVMVSLSAFSIKKYINRDSLNTATKVANQIITKSEEISS